MTAVGTVDRCRAVTLSESVAQSGMYWEARDEFSTGKWFPAHRRVLTGKNEQDTIKPTIPKRCPKDGSACNDQGAIFEDPEQHDGRDFSGYLVCSGPTCCHALQPWDGVTEWQHYRKIIGYLFRRFDTDQRGL